MGMKGVFLMENSEKNRRGNTDQPVESLTRQLEIWSRGLRKQGTLSSKAANAADLALCFWGMMTDEQRDAVSRDGNAAYIMRNLVDNHGFSWV